MIIIMLVGILQVYYFIIERGLLDFVFKYHCMIRMFDGDWWYQTIRDGVDIWNDF